MALLVYFPEFISVRNEYKHNEDALWHNENELNGAEYGQFWRCDSVLITSCFWCTGGSFANGNYLK